MKRAMAGRGEAAATAATDFCIWMTAGALSYRLCDRAFDCDHCPLDAALQKRPQDQPSSPALTPPRHGAWDFPADRSYAFWHVWLAIRDGSRFTLGLDAFAAELLVTVTGVCPAAVGSQIRKGEVVCRVASTFGSLPLRTPVACEITRMNPALALDPTRAVHTPYDDGWLLEAETRGPDAAAEVAELLAADVMRDQARLDLRRFRRQVAMHLLASSPNVGATMADGGEPLTDLRPLLGHSRHLEIVRGLVG